MRVRLTAVTTFPGRKNGKVGYSSLTSTAWRGECSGERLGGLSSYGKFLTDTPERARPITALRKNIVNL